MYPDLKESILLFLINFALSFALFPPYIRWQNKRKVGQKIKKEGPELHLHKENTPSGGGVIIALTTVLVFLFFSGTSNHPLLIPVFLGTLGFFGIGLIDDLLKIFHNRPWGIKARNKLLFQLLFSMLIMVLGREIFPHQINLPFSEKQLILTPWSFFFYGVFLLIATTNAFNITDGLDGLAGGCGFLTMLFWSSFFLLKNMPHYAGFCFAISGSLMAFLYFNAWPAKIFMGDSGSLFIGAIIAVVALLSGQSLLIIFSGIIYIVDTLSVIIQVFYYKFFKKRVFLMSPIHHHFELKGLKESFITTRFWIIQCLGCLLALYGMGR